MDKLTAVTIKDFSCKKYTAYFKFGCTQIPDSDMLGQGL